MGKRNLTQEEIQILEQNHCRAEDWSLISVSEHFIASRCQSVLFYGPCSIGNNEGYVYNPIGYEEPYGIRYATIVNCNIGDNVLIEAISDVIANYDIGNNCIIKNVSKLSVEGETTFGNGLRVKVLNETGGREVPIFNDLTAQVAHILAMYRHDLPLIESLNAMIDRYVERLKATRGVIGDNTLIRFCGKIKNVHFGPYSNLEGASLLINGSINSCQEAPVEVGVDVNCRDFILSAGSQITDGVQITTSFIGQSCHFSHLFSAHDSLFFANCQGENGEACAIFAGPYTVSMHKSSLLIAGYYSFLNAGSGSNQSNHLYKLGPIHQGIVERGSKTTSDSYILWPSRIGSFSLIMGRHVSHIDSSNFPFSYLLEGDNKTYLVPGVNLRSVGTIRDSKKWPARDGRFESIKLDNINFDLLSPYTIGKMVRGYHILGQIESLLSSSGQDYVYKNMHIRSSALSKGREYYRIGIEKYIGNSLVRKLLSAPFVSEKDMIELLTPNGQDGYCDWLDICGMITPRSKMITLLSDVKKGVFQEIHEVNEVMRKLHKSYYTFEWEWSYQLLLDWFHLKPEDLTIDRVKRIMKQWIDAVVRLDKLLYEDARKEFEMFAQVGFGIDMSEEETEKRVRDFEQVRGSFESNSFVQGVQLHIEHKQNLYDEVLLKLQRAES